MYHDADLKCIMILLYSNEIGVINMYIITSEKEGVKSQEKRKTKFEAEIFAHVKKNQGYDSIIEKEKVSRAADLKKSRANAAGIIQIRLTEKAKKQLEALAKEWNMNKTEVINKLLEEQEQRQLL